MKTLLLFVIILMSSPVFSQSKSDCCDLSATQKFSDLGKDEDFRLKHPDPTPFDYSDMIGEMITFKTSDGKTANGYMVTHQGNTIYNNWILVFHEWYGLNDYIKEESDKLHYETGANILAVDLYDGKVADNREDASKYMQSVDQTRAVNIVEGAIDYCGDNAKIGTIGWCFGGGWSLNAALIAGVQADACVIYYGMPSDDVEKLKTLDCPVLGIFAEQDGHITPEVVKQFEENMAKAGKQLTVYMYDAGHGFANPSNPKHDKTATADAMSKTVAFFKEYLTN